MALTEFGQRLDGILRACAAPGWEVKEEDSPHPLEKRLLIRTPGWEMPETIRQEIRDAAIKLTSAAYKTTLRFEP